MALKFLGVPQINAPAVDNFDGLHYAITINSCVSAQPFGRGRVAHHRDRAARELPPQDGSSRVPVVRFEVQRCAGGKCRATAPRMGPERNSIPCFRSSCRHQCTPTPTPPLHSRVPIHSYVIFTMVLTLPKMSKQNLQQTRNLIITEIINLAAHLARATRARTSPSLGPCRATWWRTAQPRCPGGIDSLVVQDHPNWASFFLS